MDKAYILKNTITLQAFKDYVCYHRRPMVPSASALPYNKNVHIEALGISNAFGGEAGELQNIVKKLIKNEGIFSGSDDLHEKFVLEAGDALHYLVSLITLLGYSVEQVMAENITKLDARREQEERRLDEKRQALLAEATA